MLEGPRDAVAGVQQGHLQYCPSARLPALPPPPPRGALTGCVVVQGVAAHHARHVWAKHPRVRACTHRSTNTQHRPGLD